jgi:chaperone required for assembly of F1-ATPase
MMPPTARRLYDSVAILGDTGSFRVLLKGRPVRTPGGSVLSLPTAALAAGVANEWLSQGATIRPETMPLTRLAVTAIDRIAARRRSVIDALLAYAGSDLLCYRAEEPDDLVVLQAGAWQPLVDWAGERWGARMVVGRGVVPVDQPEAALRALRGAVDRVDDVELAALSSAVQASGSLLIGLALLHGRLDAQAAYDAALLDECYQARRWGVDAEAECRRQAIAEDLRAVAAFVSLARSRPAASS